MVRSLLSLFPAASALLAFRANGAPIPQPAFMDAGFAIAVQCWSFREFTLFESIEMAAATGAGGVELYSGQKLGGGHGDLKLGPDLTGRQLRSLIDHLAMHHLAAINLGVIEIPKEETAARKIFEFARKLNLHGITPSHSLRSIRSKS